MLRSLTDRARMAGERVWRGALVSVVAGTISAPTIALAGPGDEEQAHATVKLYASHDSVAAGATVLLGVTFDIEEGWHLYWDGKNDSGMPISVDLTLPEGFVAEPMLWAAPHRMVSPGEILDHVYEREVTLLIPLRVPEALEPGETVRISADVDWLACEEFCIPESDRVSIELEVVSGTEEMRPSRAARLIKLAHARIPKELTAKTKGVGLVWEGSTLVLTAEGASEMLFYPKSECPDLIEPIEGAVAEGGSLRLDFDEEDESKQVLGVLEVVRANQRYPRLYVVWTPRPE